VGGGLLYEADVESTKSRISAIRARAFSDAEYADENDDCRSPNVIVKVASQQFNSSSRERQAAEDR
jgi:hypothetical protein